jgi:hypothetical protein
MHAFRASRAGRRQIDPGRPALPRARVWDGTETSRR